jgi:flavorubredoxin
VARGHTDDDLKRYIGALGERLEHKIDSIAEQHGGIMRKLGEHDQRFEKIERKLDVHTVMIVELKEDVTIIKQDVETIKADVRKRVTYDEFSALVKRVGMLEKRVRS